MLCLPVPPPHVFLPLPCEKVAVSLQPCQLLQTQEFTAGFQNVDDLTENEPAAFFTQHAHPNDRAAAFLLHNAQLRCVCGGKLLLMSGWVVVK